MSLQPESLQPESLQPESLQLRIRHVTGYAYPDGSRASYNEARMTPLTTSDQTLLHARLDISPAPWSFEYRDYWGSVVTAFEVHEAHRELEVVATATVETSSTASTSGGALAWDDLPAVADRWCEFLTQSSWTAPPAALLADLEPLRVESASPGEFARVVADFLHERLAYLPGSTSVETTAAEAWGSGSGVCQDFAHLMLGVLRDAGIPARYVSGYLHPSLEPVVGQTVAGESHAWVEWFDGGDWTGWDPTNAIAPGARHVVVARGRDYADNPPLRGIHASPGAPAALSVSVEITRLR